MLNNRLYLAKSVAETKPCGCKVFIKQSKTQINKGHVAAALARIMAHVAQYPGESNARFELWDGPLINCIVVVNCTKEAIDKYLQ